MRFSVLFIHKVRVIGADEFYLMFTCQLYQGWLNSFLLFESITIGTLHGVFHLMAHQFDVKIIAKNAFEPFNGLFSFCNLSIFYVTWYFTSQTSRGGNDTFVVFLDGFMVGTRTLVVTIHPCFTDNLDQIVVTDFVLSQED